MATISSSSPRGSLSPEDAKRSYTVPFVIMTILFFMWGFVTSWNDILIPRFKDAFSLTYTQSMLVQFAFFGAYGVGSFFYFVSSMIWGDPINRIGYKNGVIIGLLASAVGLATFFPAALMVSYPLFLTGLFVLGLGLAILQIAANPYVTILGPEHSASSRLNLSQAFNSVGTTIGPVFVGYLVFTVFATAGAHGADSVKYPYLCAAIVFVLLAVLFAISHLPSFTNTEHIPRGLGALKHPHTALGMLAIFMYVGGEVTVGSTIVNLLGSPSLGGLTHEQASPYLTLFWGGLMIGRFMGAFALSDLSPTIKRLCVIGVPIVAFLLAWKVAGIGIALPYGGPLVLLIIAFFVGAKSPNRMLALFGAIIIIFLGVGVFGSGDIAKWAILSVGMYMSVMWSNIFALAIEGLGPLKSQGSSLLIMGIVGGAFLPLLQGKMADHMNIQFSFIIPMIAFAYIVFYGLVGYRIGRKDI